MRFSIHPMAGVKKIDFIKLITNVIEKYVGCVGKCAWKSVRVHGRMCMGVRGQICVRGCQCECMLGPTEEFS